jgi:hypothetical protein
MAYHVREYLERELRGPHRGSTHDHPDLDKIVPRSLVWTYAIPTGDSRTSVSNSWSGPWTVRNFCGDHFYHLVPHPSWRGVKSRMVHLNTIKAFNPPDGLQKPVVVAPAELFFGLDRTGRHRQRSTTVAEITVGRSQWAHQELGPTQVVQSDPPGFDWSTCRR